MRRTEYSIEARIAGSRTTRSGPIRSTVERTGTVATDPEGGSTRCQWHCGDRSNEQSRQSYAVVAQEYVPPIHDRRSTTGTFEWDHSHCLEDGSSDANLFRDGVGGNGFARICGTCRCSIGTSRLGTATVCGIPTPQWERRMATTVKCCHEAAVTKNKTKIAPPGGSRCERILFVLDWKFSAPSRVAGQATTRYLLLLPSTHQHPPAARDGFSGTFCVIDLPLPVDGMDAARWLSSRSSVWRFWTLCFGVHLQKPAGREHFSTVSSLSGCFRN